MAAERELQGREDAAVDDSVFTRDAAMGKGDDELFEKKMTKEEKKAAAKAAREAKRKAKEAAKALKNSESTSDLTTATASSTATSANGDDNNNSKAGSMEPIVVDPNASAEEKREAALENLSRENIIVTYEAKKTILHPNARDINVSGVTVTYHGKPLIEESDIVINWGNRYGLIGQNGSGKSILMKVRSRVVWGCSLGKREAPRPMSRRACIIVLTRRYFIQSYPFFNFLTPGDCCTSDSYPRES